MHEGTLLKNTSLSILRPLGRRPIWARGTPRATVVAGWLARLGVTPNQISIASIGFALIAAGAPLAAGSFGGVGRAGLLVGAVLAIGLRPLANLLDGLVAVEHERHGPAGELFNEVPDRVSDPVIFVAAGYAAGGPFGSALGWTAAVLAVLTAHVRTLGAALGSPGLFLGPMAKAQRMALLTLGCLVAATEAVAELPPRALLATLGLMAIGCVVTCWRRRRHCIKVLTRHSGHGQEVPMVKKSAPMSSDDNLRRNLGDKQRPHMVKRMRQTIRLAAMVLSATALAILTASEHAVEAAPPAAQEIMRCPDAPGRVTFTNDGSVQPGMRCERPTRPAGDGRPAPAGDMSDTFDQLVDKTTRATIMVQIYHQAVAFELPRGWEVRPAFQAKRPDGSYIIEFLPRGQVLASWREMLTAQGFQGQTAFAPVVLLEQLARLIRQTCEHRAFFSRWIEEPAPDHHTALAIIGCARLRADWPTGVRKGEGEFGLYLAVRGIRDLYVVHRSWRGPGFDPAVLPVAQPALDEWERQLRGVRLCHPDARAPFCEQPPGRCPSCSPVDVFIGTGNGTASGNGGEVGASVLALLAKLNPEIGARSDQAPAVRIVIGGHVPLDGIGSRCRITNVGDTATPAIPRRCVAKTLQRITMALNQSDLFEMKFVVWLGIIVLIVCIVALTWLRHGDRGVPRRLARALVFGLGGGAVGYSRHVRP